MTKTVGGASPSTRRPRPSERRARALDAFIDLVLETGVRPRPETIAERSGVSIASFYRYFSDLEELRRDAFVRLTDRFGDLLQIPNLGLGEREERIAAFVASRLALHEKLHPLQLLVRAEGHGDQAVAEHVDSVRSSMAKEVERHFDAELQKLSPSGRADTVAGIAALTSVESWQQYRRSLDRTPAQTRRAWILAVDRLLPGS